MPDLTLEQIDEIQESLRAEVRRKEELIKAYDLVKQHLNSNAEPGKPVPITTGPRARLAIVPAYGHITRIVSQGIDGMAKPFTIRDLHSSIRGDEMNISIESVTTAINRLREEVDPPLKVKEPGKGRRATIFEKA